MRKLLPVLFIILLVSGCRSTDLQIDDSRESVLNIINSTDYPISEVYFQTDQMPGRGDNQAAGDIEPGGRRVFVLESGKYKMIVIFTVNEAKVQVQYNDLLLPGYEYNWELFQEKVDLGASPGFIFDLGTESAAPEESAPSPDPDAGSE